MKSQFSIPAALIAILGMSLCLMPVARAQNSDPVRVVRLSRAEGELLVSHSGSDVWEEAPVNLPLQEGDSLATQGGLAEIEFENGAMAYLAENSLLQITALGFSDDGRVTDLSLTQGAGTFYANLTSRDSFRVLTSTFNVVIPERAEFRADAHRDADHVRAGHKLAKAQKVGEFPVAEPMPLFDKDAPHPDDRPAKPVHRDFQENEEQRPQCRRRADLRFVQGR